jgi:hypothetical protein
LLSLGERGKRSQLLALVKRTVATLKAKTLYSRLRMAQPAAVARKSLSRMIFIMMVLLVGGW